MTINNEQPTRGGGDRLDRLERILGALVERDVEHDQRMAAFDERMATLAEHNAELDQRIASVARLQEGLGQRLEAMAERDRINEERLNEQGAAIARFAQIADALVAAVRELNTEVRGLRVEVQRMVQRFTDSDDRG